MDRVMDMIICYRYILSISLNEKYIQLQKSMNFGLSSLMSCIVGYIKSVQGLFFELG